MYSQANYKSPGSDGFTVECYIHFWNELPHVLLDVYDSWGTLGTVGVTFRTGIISAIFKKGDKKILKITEPFYF